MTASETKVCPVVPLEVNDGSIQIVAYDLRWPSQFEELCVSIQTQLAAAALTVEHMGSTAMPGLAAKPVIDIVLTVQDSADESAYAAALTRIGFELRVREPAWFEHRLFTHHAPRANLHVFSSGCPEIRRMRRFRDWLRVCAEDRELYERTKRSLAQRHWRCVQDYADAKTGIIGEIARRASALPMTP